MIELRSPNCGDLKMDRKYTGIDSTSAQTNKIIAHEHHNLDFKARSKPSIH